MQSNVALWTVVIGFGCSTVQIIPRSTCQYLYPGPLTSARAYTTPRTSQRALKFSTPKMKFLISPTPLNLFLHHPYPFILAIYKGCPVECMP